MYGCARVRGDCACACGCACGDEVQGAVSCRLECASLRPAHWDELLQTHLSRAAGLEDNGLIVRVQRLQATSSPCLLLTAGGAHECPWGPLDSTPSPSLPPGTLAPTDNLPGLLGSAGLSAVGCSSPAWASRPWPHSVLSCGSRGEPGQPLPVPGDGWAGTLQEGTGNHERAPSRSAHPVSLVPSLPVST